MTWRHWSRQSQPGWGGRILAPCLRRGVTGESSNLTDLTERLEEVELRSCGRRLDVDRSAVGALKETDAQATVEALRTGMEDDGYLFLPGFLDSSDVGHARSAILAALSNEGVLDGSAPQDKGIVRDDYTSDFQSENDRFPQVRSLVECDRVRTFFDHFLGGDSRSLDHIWLRMKSPGRATAPHCDIVYMNRGTKNLFTIWIPLGDVPLELGPLMVLEGSHRSEKLRRYCEMDVDKKVGFFNWHYRHGGFFRGGQYTKNPLAAQREIGGRWLTADFKAGDLITFKTSTLHGSLDNQSKQIRLSADARYQLASEPIDSRWTK